MFCPKCGTLLPDDAGFCIKCGGKVSLASGQQASGQPGEQVLAPSGATQLKCPSCGAPITPKFGEMIITCEYCGSSVTLGNEGWKSINNHTMLPVKISQRDEAMKLVHDMMDRGLLHRHLQESSVLVEINLAMIPYWLVPVSARTSVVSTDVAVEAGTIATTAALAVLMGAAMSKGRGGGGIAGGVVLGSMMRGDGESPKKAHEMDSNYNFPIVALKALTEYQPKDYQFALGERGLFDAARVKGVKVLNGDIGEEMAKYQAKTLVDQLQAEKAHAAHHLIQQLSTESDVGEAELLHAPVWFANYEHKGSRVVLVIDGNSGGVINSVGL